jgi:hypothetical protein
MTEPKGDLPCFAIVRRGELEVFQTLKVELEEPDVVRVIWDRRIGERRSRDGVEIADDRRRQDRRGPPPEMWATFGFVVTPRRS